MLNQKFAGISEGRKMPEKKSFIISVIREMLRNFYFAGSFTKDFRLTNDFAIFQAWEMGKSSASGVPVCIGARTPLSASR